jgi:hypothetical protein
MVSRLPHRLQAKDALRSGIRLSAKRYVVLHCGQMISMASSFVVQMVKVDHMTRKSLARRVFNKYSFNFGMLSDCLGR